MKVGMNKPELYNASNKLQRQSTLDYLTKYASKIKWNEFGDTAIDLGCGDGSVSTLLKNFAPYKFKKFVACDISEEMINFAKKRYAEDTISFRVFDIGGDLPEDLIGAFNHVFSFYALHWLRDQEKAFRNIYNLLTDQGDVFITMLGTTAIYSVYKALATHSKWKSWLKQTDEFLSPYHGVQNPEKIVADIMEKCGFKNIDVQFKRHSSVFNNLQDLINTVQSVEPFNMPQDVFDEFIKDYIAVAQDIGMLVITKSDDNDIISVTYEYALIVISASK